MGIVTHRCKTAAQWAGCSKRPRERPCGLDPHGLELPGLKTGDWCADAAPQGADTKDKMRPGELLATKPSGHFIILRGLWPETPLEPGSRWRQPVMWMELQNARLETG